MVLERHPLGTQWAVGRLPELKTVLDHGFDRKPLLVEVLGTDLPQDEQRSHHYGHCLVGHELGKGCAQRGSGTHDIINEGGPAAPHSLLEGGRQPVASRKEVGPPSPGDWLSEAELRTKRRRQRLSEERAAQQWPAYEVDFVVPQPIPQPSHERGNEPRPSKERIEIQPKVGVVP